MNKQNAIIHSALDKLEDALADVYTMIQANQQPINIIVPKEATPPPVFNITLPPITVNVPASKPPSVVVKSAPITVNAPKQETPVVNMRIPEAKKPLRSREQQYIQRDVSGNMTGTQSMQEYEYEE